MNPLTAHLEKYRKQPPLIKEDEDEPAGVKKRSFSNCVLFVLLAVFVFFLACLAVYTAIAMGIPVEKNEAAPLKSELSSNNVQVLPDNKTDKTPPKVPNTNTTQKAGNDSATDSNPRLRIQIFIKGKEAENSKELSDPEQNKTEETVFKTRPVGRIFLRRIIIFRKPEIDSSEEVSTGSDESTKDVQPFKPSGISNAPNPLDIFFNLLKLTQAPIDNIFNMLEKQKNRLSNVPETELSEKSDEDVRPIVPEGQCDKEEGPKSEQKYNQSEKNENISSQEKQSVMGSEKEQESSPIENVQYKPEKLVSDAQSMEQKEHYNENATPGAPQAMTTPAIRYFRFINPDQPQVTPRPNNYPPLHQRIVYQHPNPYGNIVTRQPYREENVQNKGSFIGGNGKMDDIRYKTTMTPTTQTPYPSDVYSTTPNYFSTPSDKNIYRENLRETTNHQIKETPNQMMPTSNKGQPGMIDRINTDNIDPFENFFKFRSL